MQHLRSQIKKLKSIPTPYYLYDTSLLGKTLNVVKRFARKYHFEVHYALKANCHDKILKTISSHGLGADCVSGNEILKAIETGFPPEKIVFAGVGKTNREIEIAIQNDVLSINCESAAEIEVVDAIAAKYRKIANIAIRINPNIDAATHAKITTGLNENKFGIDEQSIPQVLQELKLLPNVNLYSLHFHIGSQIVQMDKFKQLAQKVGDYVEMVERDGFRIKHLNMGGGLGIDYHSPEENPIADFEAYFDTFKGYLPRGDQQIHFELGRSIVGQSGALISKLLYVKEGVAKKFAIVDGSMTELIRPALYEAFHKVVHLSPHTTHVEKYDVVGPVCESSDVFAVDVDLPILERGDLVAILSAGAYGDVMSSNYNLRERPKSYFSDEL